MKLHRELLGWLSRIARWLISPGPVPFAIAISIVAVLLVLGPFRTELGARSVGLVLQLLGLLTTAFGLRDTRRLFGKPTVLESIRGWLASFPPRRRSVEITVTGSSGVGIGGRVQADVWKGPGDSLETRLNAIEQNLRQVRDFAIRSAADHDQRLREAKDALSKEAGLREAQDRELENKIRAATADGLDLAYAGLLWVGVGLVLATLPNELLAAAAKVGGLASLAS